MDFFGSILQVVFCSILVLAFGMWAIHNPGWVFWITGMSLGFSLVWAGRPEKHDDTPVWK